MVGFLSLYCGDRTIAEEIGQDALAILCRDWAKVKDIDHREAWVQRVGINLANSFYRRRAAEKRARQRLEGLATPTSAPAHNPDALALKEALLSLPKRQRGVLILRYYADLTFPEIAATLDMPLPTVKSLARRALQKLREDERVPGVQEVGLA